MPLHKIQRSVEKPSLRVENHWLTLPCLLVHIDGEQCYRQELLVRERFRDESISLSEWCVVLFEQNKYVLT